jgi:hypothetical protein
LWTDRWGTYRRFEYLFHDMTLAYLMAVEIKNGFDASGPTPFRTLWGRSPYADG